MGNECDCGGCHFHGGYGAFGGYGYGPNRSGWKAVSDGAYRRLDEAKNLFQEFVKTHSFKNINDDNYKFTKKHAIKLHLVGKLRPRFNEYVKKFGAKPKWVKLTDKEKKSISKHKNRVSAVYFCDLTIDKTVINKLRESEPDAFKDELLLTEISLFTFLVSMGIPEIDSLGWIVPIPKEQKIEKIPKIKNLSHFLDQQQAKKSGIIFIETTNEYKANPNKKSITTKKAISISSSSSSAKRSRSPLKAITNSPKQRKITSFGGDKENKKSNKSPKKRKKRSIADLCSDDEWTPNSDKKRKRGTSNKRRKLG